VPTIRLSGNHQQAISRRIYNFVSRKINALKRRLNELFKE
jgi:hypothetical protein